jgi:hypothetical protein
MTVQPSNPAPEAPAAEAPKPTAPPEPVATAPETPPWGEDFNPERAWKTIQNLREREKELSKHALTPEQKSKLAEFERLSEASKSELEKAQDAAKKSAERAEAYLTSAIKAEIKALATGFADPTDAVSALDPKSFANESGEIDSDGIKTALADLLAKKPHWAKSPETRVPAPNPAQGSSGSGASGASQLSEAQVKEMYARKDYDGIAKAQAEGRLSGLLGS